MGKLIGVPKLRSFVIKFNSMADILLSYNSWFDSHGNLCVAHHGNFNENDGMLAPSYFHLLGKLKKIDVSKDGHRYPVWMIESEYEDIFAPNQALRKIASGKLDLGDCIETSKEAVMFP